MEQLTTAQGNRVGKLFLLVLACILFSSFSITPILAQTTSEIRQESTNPNSGFGFIAKRLGEKFRLFLFSPFPKQKEQAYERLSQVRLAELKYTIEGRDMANFEKATIRYSTSVGNWVEYINKKKLNGEKSQAVQTLNSQIPVVKELMDKFNPTTAEWRFVKEDLDYLQLYISQLAS